MAYLDLAYMVWRAAAESAGAGWGLIVDDSGPPPSGYIPETYNARGTSLGALFQALGSEGRANGVKAEPQADGYTLLTVGLPPWEQYDGVLAAPLNCREVGVSGAGRGVASVTAEGGGESATASDAAARFPGRQLINAGASNAKYAAQATLNTVSRQTGTIELRVKIGESGIRVGDVALYIRATGGTTSGVYLRVVSIAVDDSLLPTEFRLVGQVVEPDALAPVALTGGAYWPGTRGTGNPLTRRLRSVENRQ